MHEAKPEEDVRALWFGVPWHLREYTEDGDKADSDGDKYKETEEVARVCSDPAKRVKIPYGRLCDDCGKKITSSVSGVILPMAGKDELTGGQNWAPICNECWDF